MFRNCWKCNCKPKSQSSHSAPHLNKWMQGIYTDTAHQSDKLITVNIQKTLQILVILNPDSPPFRPFQTVRVVPNDCFWPIVVFWYFYSPFFGSCKIHVIHRFWTRHTSQKAKKSTDRIFRLQRVNLYYDIYHIKRFSVTHRNIWNRLFESFIFKQSTFWARTAFQIIEHCASSLVKKCHASDTVRYTLNYFTGNLIGVGRVKFDL